MVWTTATTIVSTVAGTLAVMKSLGRGFAWLGHKFGEKFSAVISAEIAKQLEVSERKIAVRVSDVILEPERLSKMSRALADSTEFRELIRECVFRAVGFRPHRINGGVAGD